MTWQKSVVPCILFIGARSLPGCVEPPDLVSVAGSGGTGSASTTTGSAAAGAAEATAVESPALR